MRMIAASLVLAFGMVGFTHAAEHVSGNVGDSVGKPAQWENWTYSVEPEPVPPAPVAIVSSDETPNERRERLGLPIELSAAPADYGEALETPNQRRARLGLPLDLPPTPDYGIQQETPNQLRRRLALVTTGF
jgi:hypothetical protein